MRNRDRVKLDWSKPFKFIDSKKVFDDLDTSDDTSPPPEQMRPPKKEDIMVPRIDTVQRIGQVKKFAKLTPNYIRLPAHLNLPLANQYELTQVDHIFLRNHQDRFIFHGKRIFTQDLMKRIFIELQMRAGKDMTLPRSKGWMINFLQKEYKELLEMDNVDYFADLVYNYWKSRREELRFPLLRLLWKPNPQQYNHMLAFRPREREKRSLRRTNRILEDQIIEELYEQYTLGLKVVDRIQMREDLKLKQVQLQFSSFYSECKGFVEQPQFIGKKMDQISKDKEKIRYFHAQIEGYRSRKQSLETVSVQEPTVDNLDQKQTIVNFLSSVIHQAQRLGVSYERIFYPTNSLVMERSKSLQAPINFVQEPILEKAQPQQKLQQNVLAISLSKFENILMRSFKEELNPIHHVRPCKDFLELKRRKVDGYYFGSDDEGETKDVRKTITNSFKKFQQMQQLTRTASIMSQN